MAAIRASFGTRGAEPHEVSVALDPSLKTEEAPLKDVVQQFDAFREAANTFLTAQVRQEAGAHADADDSEVWRRLEEEEGEEAAEEDGGGVDKEDDDMALDKSRLRGEGVGPSKPFHS